MLIKAKNKQTNIIMLGLFPYIGLLTHHEAQLRSELSEAINKAAETGRSISEGMYKIFFLIKSSRFFLKSFYCRCYILFILTGSLDASLIFQERSQNNHRQVCHVNNWYQRSNS